MYKYFISSYYKYEIVDRSSNPYKYIQFELQQFS